MISIGTGVASGAVTAFVAGLLLLAAKRLRNARRISRGEPPAKDEILQVFWLPAVAVGAITGAVANDPRTAALGGAAVPLLVVVAAVVLALRD